MAAVTTVNATFLNATTNDPSDGCPEIIPRSTNPWTRPQCLNITEVFETDGSEYEYGRRDIHRRNSLPVGKPEEGQVTAVLNSTTTTIESTTEVPCDNTADLLLPQVILMGMPMVSTVTLRTFFDCGNLTVADWRCKRASTLDCGSCVEGADIVLGLPSCPARYGCEGFRYWASRSGPMPGDACFYAQMEDTMAIFENYPNATFILHYESPWHWLEKIAVSGRLHERITKCNIPGLPSGIGTSHYDLVRWYSGHYVRMHQFAAMYPHVTLLDVDVNSMETAEIMAHRFGIDEKCWNVNVTVYAEDENLEYEEHFTLPHHHKIMSSARLAELILGVTIACAVLLGIVALARWRAHRAQEYQAVTEARYMSQAELPKRH